MGSAPLTIALYTTETMADWEYAYLTTQLADAEAMRPGRFELALVGDGTDEVRSLGRLPVRPTHDLDHVSALLAEGRLAVLVIPGGDRYDEGHDRLVGLVEQVLAAGVPVAAICGATFLLARTGFLDDRAHTSNAPEYLQMSGYLGGERYLDQPCVNDAGLITASGMRPVHFTAAVMREIDLFPASIIDAWEQLNLTGEREHFAALMEALGAWQNA